MNEQTQSILNHQDLLHINDTAELLGVSTATVRNWVKSGALPLNSHSHYVFNKKEVEQFKLKLHTGQLEKLNKRANKIKSKKIFFPQEYTQNKTDQEILSPIIMFIQKHNIDISQALFFLSLNFLKKQQLITTKEWKDIIQEKERGISNSYKEDVKHESSVIKNPLNIYGMDIDPIAIKIARLNILVKFKDNSWTPNIFHKNALIDIENYSLFHRAHEKPVNNFNLIATNPPWGAHFSKKDKNTLRNIYPEINSFESFSYFIKKSLNQLCDQGIAVFILPESILNVKAHKDIREIILRKFEVIKIIKLGRVFKNVFTPVIRLDLKKLNYEKKLTVKSFPSHQSARGYTNHPVALEKETNKNSIKYLPKNQVLIQHKTKKHKINQMRWFCNLDFVFDVNIDPFDYALISKIYKKNHLTLKNKADWALGIVTGDNKKFVSRFKKIGYEPIYTGKEVQKFILSKPSYYIDFQPDKFQQVAKINKYRAEKNSFTDLSQNS